MAAPAGTTFAEQWQIKNLFLRPLERAPVSGLWLAESRSQGGLGSWLELHGNGTVRAGFGAVIESTYRMDGTSRSLMTKGEALTLPSGSRKFKRAGETLVTTDSKGQPLTYCRAAAE
jgi:hypothetical protein